jgi:hypothetical protein
MPIPGSTDDVAPILGAALLIQEARAWAGRMYNSAGLAAFGSPAVTVGSLAASGDVNHRRKLATAVGSARPPAPGLLAVIEAYLDSRAIRFPGGTKRKAGDSTWGLSRWPARSPLFVGRDGERITRGTLQSRIKRAFKCAGPEAQPVPGALVHGLRHTYATELAGSDVSVYTLMKLLGHESMTTSQRYVNAAGTETRSAAARNGLYALIPGCANDVDLEVGLDRD